jgi:hypothetical protein
MKMMKILAVAMIFFVSVPVQAVDGRRCFDVTMAGGLGYMAYDIGRRVWSSGCLENIVHGYSKYGVRRDVVREAFVCLL